MNILTINSPRTSKVWFGEDKIYFLLEDGRELGVPIDWFPKLRDANEEGRNNWRLIADGDGVHWSDLDEDISIESLLISN